MHSDSSPKSKAQKVSKVPAPPPAECADINHRSQSGFGDEDDGEKEREGDSSVNYNPNHHERAGTPLSLGGGLNQGRASFRRELCPINHPSDSAFLLERRKFEIGLSAPVKV